MSFFGKIKQGLGLGGVSVKLEVNPEISWQDKEINGKIILSSKSTQQVKDIEIRFEDLYKYNNKDGQIQLKTFELGRKKLGTAFEIKAGEVKELDFVLPFSFAMSSDDKLKSYGGVVGKLGSVGSFLNKTNDTYTLWATAEVAGVVFNPNSSVKMSVRAK